MMFLRPDLSDTFLKSQLDANKSVIDALKLLLHGKRLEDVRDDYDLLCRCNTIARDLDKGRTFPHYDKDKRVKDSLQTLTRLKNDKLFATYCDIGCGMGYYPRAAFELGCDYSCGIDIDTRHNEVWNYYTQGTNRKLQYICADITGGRPPQTFDLVTSFAAFEHFSDPHGMLETMAEFVAEEGLLYIHFAPIYHATGGLHMYRHISIPWFHLIFSENAIDEYCKNIGLSDYRSWSYSVLNKWTALDYVLLFSNLSSLHLVSCRPLWELRHYWFVKLFPALLPSYSLEDLLINGYTIIYKNICSPESPADGAKNKLKINQLQAELKKEQDRRLKMKSTLSWRFTSPLRKMKNFFAE